MPIYYTENPIQTTGSGSSGGGGGSISGSVIVTASLTNPVAITGSVYVLNQQEVTGFVTASISGTVPVTGSVKIDNRSISSTFTKISASISATLLLSSKIRNSFSIYNHSTNILYLKFGSGINYDSFSLAMGSNNLYESPNGYSGEVWAIWDNPVTGSAQITEYI